MKRLQGIDNMSISLVERGEGSRTLQADDSRFVVPGVSWRAYKTLADELSPSSPIRIAYDGRNMELMVRGPMHHRHASWIDRLITTVADERSMPFEDLGETTWEREDVSRGIEADLSYVFAPEKIEAVRDALERNSNKVADYPDPDLVVEVDISPPQLDREGIYSALRVSEVWVFDGQVLAIHRLGPNGSYSRVETSGWLGIRAEQAKRWLTLEDRRDRKAWTARLAEWIRGGMNP
jgi:Uma2 family endonuclease